MAKSKNPPKQIDPARMAEEIASGRVKARISVRRSPMTLSDALSGGLEVFQPSAWKAPRWRRHGPALRDSTTGATGYVCDDPFQQAFAVEAMKVASFSLPDFDLWLDGLEASPARDELAIHRYQLCDSIAENDQVAIGTHCGFLSTRVHAVNRELATRPMIERDTRLQASKRNPRGSRAPKLDEWLDKQRLDLSNERLWELLPTDEFHPVYRDGDEVFEEGRIYKKGEKAGGANPVKRDSFDKRVTAARARQKAKTAASN